MTRVVFLAAAQAEVDEAVAYFDEQREGLGDRFERDLFATVQSIKAQPASGKFVSGRIRKWRLRTFRYNLIYMADPDEIIVVAVAHHRRRPNYWRSRLPRLR